MSKSDLNVEYRCISNAGIPDCRTVASHTTRPEYLPVVLKWLMLNVDRIHTNTELVYIERVSKY